jgi:hypothetical protein
LHVTRDKGVLPERDGYTPEPDVLVVDAGVLGPGDAFVHEDHVHFVAESVSRSTVGQGYGRKLNQYAARGIDTDLIVDVLVGERVRAVPGAKGGRVHLGRALPLRRRGRLRHRGCTGDGADRFLEQGVGGQR